MVARHYNRQPPRIRPPAVLAAATVRVLRLNCRAERFLLTGERETGFMKPVSRSPVNKNRSARQFKRNTRTVAAANTAGGLMRGGWRL